jgi:hypothetical protein
MARANTTTSNLNNHQFESSVVTQQLVRSSSSAASYLLVPNQLVAQQPRRSTCPRQSPESSFQPPLPRLLPAAAGGLSPEWRRRLLGHDEQMKQRCYTYGIFLRTRVTDATWFSFIGKPGLVVPIFPHPYSRLIATYVRKFYLWEILP